MENNKNIPLNLKVKLNLEKALSPFWQEDAQPGFISRTNTKYSTMPLSVLKDRGIENRLLDSLCQYLPDGVFIAGGFLASLFNDNAKSKDIDFFFTSPQALKETIELIEDPPDDEDAWAWRDYQLITEKMYVEQASGTLRFVEFKHKKNLPNLQLIKLVWYTGAEHVIDSFDFTAVQFATDGKNLIFNPMSIMDVIRKRLVLHRMQFPASTLRRMIKYTAKGYYACPGALQTIAVATQNSLNENPDLDQFVYID